MASFPDGFVWGASTASYQIEGAAAEDGRGPSVWDMMCERPGAIYQGHTGAVADDHYHRYREDVDLLAKMNANAYRFSISWSRVMPTGAGEVNQKGIDFYNRLIDALLEKNIQPFVTLFHWDYPMGLYHRGGWMNPDSSQWFADYAALCAEKFGDRVGHWMTFNEPQCFVGGHYTAFHAPGLKLAWNDVRVIMKNVQLSHGRGVQAIRAHSPRPCQVGIAPVAETGIAHTDSEADIQATRNFMFDIRPDSFWQTSFIHDPMILGGYPGNEEAVRKGIVPDLSQDDIKIIQQPIDFFGMNTYQAERVRAAEGKRFEVVPTPIENPLTAFRWNIRPECLYWGPKLFHERYQLPIYITENGCSNVDIVSLDGKVHDPQRIDYLHRHLLQLRRAIADGADVRGYLQWSLLDNFEWAEGYKERFGLIYVNYETLERIPKDSYSWYANVIAQNGANL